MVSMLVWGVNETAIAAPAFDMGRGAIAGAFIVALAFLAGYAAIRRSGLAVCALLMVAGAAALEFSWLGFLSALPSEMAILVMGLFAAAAIIFLSATVTAAKYNPLLGGVMFTAALIIAGMGVINFFDRVDVAPVMRIAVIGVGAFAILLALSQAVRGDTGARLILPGIALAMAAPLLGPLGLLETGAMTLAPHALFTLGIIAASLVALTEDNSATMSAAQKSMIGEPVSSFSDADSAQFAGERPHTRARQEKERAEIVLDSSLAKVLDYSGVAIWDWSPEHADYTDSLPALLGADNDAPFTPDAFSKFIAKKDLQKFNNEVFKIEDGPFDIAVQLFDGRKVRLRGARAASEGGAVLDRIVAFVETASPKFKPSSHQKENTSLSSTALAAAAPHDALTEKLAIALDKGDIVAAFQPIVALEDKKIIGYEALARWRDEKTGEEEAPETFVRAADQAGKGSVLAKTMIEAAASFLAEKIKIGKSAPAFVAMNVSWGQMRDPAFKALVQDTMKKYNLPPDSLVLELTEGDAIEGDGAAAIFSALKETGAALAFDDFGAGFSCLTNLRKFDFDYLKIDKSFAVDLETGGDGAAIAGALASLGKQLGLKVIVEGVESENAIMAAQKLGLDFAQGYALGKPEELAPSRAVRKDLKTSEETEKAPSNAIRALSADGLSSDQMSANDEEHKSSRWSLFRRSEMR